MTVNPNLLVLCFLLFLISCTTHEIIDPKPVISISKESNISTKQIKGKVEGINQRMYNLVAYAKLNGSWYTMHSKEYPIIPIDSEYCWECALVIDEGKVLSEITFFLIPNGYTPPILSGEKIIPVKLNIIASAKHTMYLD
jgi:hypothetical protein